MVNQSVRHLGSNRNKVAIATLFRTWLIPVIIIDFSLFPMFHVFGIPWKPGYIGILLAIPLYSNMRSNDRWRQARGFVFAFALLAAATVAGALYFEWQYGAIVGTTSLRPIIIYILAPVVFIIGLQDRRHTHNYILLIIVLFLTVNIITSLPFTSVEYFRDFYGINDILATGSFLGVNRIPGIMGNPNLTALTGTLLLLFLTMGVRWNFVRISMHTFALMVWVIIALAIFMVSRNQILAVAMITLGIPFTLTNKRSPNFLRAFIIIGMVSITLLMLSRGTIESYIGFDPIGSTSTNFGQSINAKFDSDNSFGRSVRKLPTVISRWELSPLGGTGFEAHDVFGSPQYHNDWLTVVVTGGILGIAALTYVAVRLFKLSPLLVILLLFPGTTNVLLFVPQHFFMLMLIAGMVAARQMTPTDSYPTTPTEKRRLAPNQKHHIRNGRTLI